MQNLPPLGMIREIPSSTDSLSSSSTIKTISQKDVSSPPLSPTNPLSLRIRIGRVSPPPLKSSILKGPGGYRNDLSKRIIELNAFPNNKCISEMKLSGSDKVVEINKIEVTRSAPISPCSASFKAVKELSENEGIVAGKKQRALFISSAKISERDTIIRVPDQVNPKLKTFLEEYNSLHFRKINLKKQSAEKGVLSDPDHAKNLQEVKAQIASKINVFCSDPELVESLINLNTKLALDYLSLHQDPLTAKGLVQDLSLESLTHLFCRLVEEEVYHKTPILIFRETDSLPHILFKEFQLKQVSSIIIFDEHLHPLITESKAGVLGHKDFALTSVKVKKVSKCAKAILKIVYRALKQDRKKIEFTLLQIYQQFYKAYLLKYGQEATTDAQKHVASLFFLGYLNRVISLPTNYSKDQDKINGLCVSIFLQSLVNREKATDEKWKKADQYLEKYQKYLNPIIMELCPQ